MWSELVVIFFFLNYSDNRLPVSKVLNEVLILNVWFSESLLSMQECTRVLVFPCYVIHTDSFHFKPTSF